MYPNKPMKPMSPYCHLKFNLRSSKDDDLVLYKTDESLTSTSETNNTLYLN